MAAKRKAANDGEQTFKRAKIEVKFIPGNPKFKIVQANAHMRRYIITPPIVSIPYESDNDLIKLEPWDDLPTREDELRDMIDESKIDPDSTRFGLWCDVAGGHRVTKDELIAAIGNKGVDCLTQEYQFRIARFAGIDLERLLKNDRVCRSCAGVRDDTTEMKELTESSPKMQMSAHYVLLFLEHLFKSVALLQTIGINQGDFRLANILVNPTEEEKKEGVLRTSMPVIVDFGLGTYRALKEVSEQANVLDVIGLFVSCKHGAERLRRKSKGAEKDSKNWLTSAVLESEREHIQVLLDILADLDEKKKYTMGAFLKLIEIAKAKLS